MPSSPRPRTPPPAIDPPGFDAYAGDYDAALMRGVSVSGESKEFFARGRLAWLRRCLDRTGFRATRVMDYGCGTGSATPFVFAELGAERLVGVDISESSLAVARKTHGSEQALFLQMSAFPADASFDLVFCNGVFHHIPLDVRPACIDYIVRCLRPGGLFALWENNPWNPGTQIVMSRIPFDRDAIKLSPPVARRLVSAGGLEVISTTFQFIFPSFLGVLRGLERPLARLPLGAQYQVLARKPAPA